MPKKHRILCAAILLVFFAATGVALTRVNFRIDSKIIDQAVRRYGDQARVWLERWQELIRQDSTVPEREQLKRVNDFFNQLEFVSDISHWGKSDYWATPVEFLSSRGGDCEDFSLAKYFTLRAMGVPESKLKLTYVRALDFDQPHMVLTYYTSPGAEPLVLDNIKKTIKPASKRKDLVPVYSFNGSGLWLAKQRGRGMMLGGRNRLTLWQDLLERMPEGLLTEPDKKLTADKGNRP
ncbi:MAG: transglutaminase-like cysteine peptidase [Desulfobacterales bacterium]|nr:transglutaminase-like cysteine peptidase [Desulfobacterales bacterium]